METVIYYFTGSGNSLKIAKELALRLTNTKIIRITKRLIDSEKITVSGTTGIIFPVYVSGLPIIIEEFVNRLNIPDNTYLFAIANFGESAGISLMQLDDLLKKKGKGLSAAFEILMPDNTQILFPPGTKAEQEACLKAQSEVIPDAASIIADGRIHRDLIEDARRSGKSRPHIFKPAEMAKAFYTDNKCNSCGICMKVCPMENISMIESKPLWGYHCEMCLACMQWCPNQAIQFGEKSKEWGRYRNPFIDLKEMFNNG
ncbi:MAG: 4Fe-4S dicluster domain-containing protein [Deltaproteobacteria bacterium]|nr:4Fe-4S dicluster domain-containing protein [Deltaproteobacteria bacterium]